MRDVTDIGLKQCWTEDQIKQMGSEQRQKTKTNGNDNPTQISYETNNASEKNKTADSPQTEGRPCDDLIYLRGPYTEAAIINVLKDRFSKNLFQVFNNF